MQTTIKFAKVRPTAIIPTKRDEDAGYDIYANFDEDYMEISPHETVMIPTGIACACDIDYCLIIKERGSTGAKGMAQRSGIIDSGYRGEIIVPITNTNDKPIFIAKQNSVDYTFYSNPSLKSTVKINNLTYNYNDIIVYPYEKAIAQLLVIPVPMVEVEEYTYEELKAIPSKRGMGALGSSGK